MGTWGVRSPAAHDRSSAARLYLRGTADSAVARDRCCSVAATRQCLVFAARRSRGGANDLVRRLGGLARVPRRPPRFRGRGTDAVLVPSRAHRRCSAAAVQTGPVPDLRSAGRSHRGRRAARDHPLLLLVRPTGPGGLSRHHQARAATGRPPGAASGRQLHPLPRSGPRGRCAQGPGSRRAVLHRPRCQRSGRPYRRRHRHHADDEHAALVPGRAADTHRPSVLRCPPRRRACVQADPRGTGGLQPESPPARGLQPPGRRRPAGPRLSPCRPCGRRSPPAHPAADSPSVLRLRPAVDDGEPPPGSDRLGRARARTSTTRRSARHPRRPRAPARPRPWPHRSR